MPLGQQVRAIILATFATWALVSVGLGQQLTLSFFLPIGAVITIVTLIAIFFTKVAWKWALFRGWLVQRPDLSGTWRCLLRSSFVDEATGRPIEKVGYVVIRQSLTSLSMRLYTDTARSESLSDNLFLKRAGSLFTLVVAYENVPRHDLRSAQTQIHYGCVLYDHIEHEAAELEGQYWTDRKTAGSIVLRDRKRVEITSFEAGEQLYGAVSPAAPAP